MHKLQQWMNDLVWRGATGGEYAVVLVIIIVICLAPACFAMLSN